MSPKIFHRVTGTEKSTTIITIFCVFLLHFLEVLAISQRSTDAYQQNLQEDSKKIEFRIDSSKLQSVHNNLELESLDTQELDHFLRYKKGFIVESGLGGQSNDIPRIRQDVDEGKKSKHAFPTELIDESTLRNKLLPLKSFGKKPKLVTENSRRIYRKGAKFTVVKSIKSESSYAVLQSHASTSERNLSFVFALVSVSGLVFVVLICLHAPCCLRSQTRSNRESFIKCPNRSLHEGVCGKCLLDHGARGAAKKRTQKDCSFNGIGDLKESDRKARASIFYNVSEDPFSSSQRPYTLQPLYFETSETRRHRSSFPDHGTTGCTGKLLRRTKEKTREIRLSRHGYKSMKQNDRSPDMHDPEWTSIGEFLNRRSNYRAQTYGSTETNSFADRFRRRSRDSWGSELSMEDLNAELIPPPKARKKPVELQEFPLGYSKYYCDSEQSRKVVFDPFHEAVNKMSVYETERETYQKIRLSSVDLDLKGSKKGSWKSKLKWGHKKHSCTKSCPAIVQTFPSTVRYNAQYIQAGNYSEISRNRPHHSVYIPSIFEEEDTSIFQNASYPFKTKQFCPSVDREQSQSKLSLNGELAEKLLRRDSPKKYSSTSNLQDYISSSLKEGKWRSDSSIKKAILLGTEPLAGLQSPTTKLLSSPTRKPQSKQADKENCWHHHSSVTETTPVKETSTRTEFCSQDSGTADSCFPTNSKYFEIDVSKHQSVAKNRPESLFTGLSISKEKSKNKKRDDRNFSLSETGSTNPSYYSSSEFDSGTKEKCDNVMLVTDEARSTHVMGNTQSYFPDLCSPPVKDIDYTRF